MKTRIPPLATGLVIGIWAALSQAIFQPKTELIYALSIAGQPRDLLNWIINHSLGTNLPLSEVSLEIPVLIVPGILLGSMIAAMKNGELKLRAAEDYIGAFVSGFLVANFALIMGACPIKVMVSIAYGNLVLLIGFIFVVVGAILAVEYVRWRARK